MIKIAQFGEGGFLRTFVDLYFDTLNREGGEYGVNIIKPITFGTLDKFHEQNNKYHVILRGMKEGKAVEDVYKVNSLESVIDPFNEIDKFYALAEDKDLKIIVSNTTEAGICYNENDTLTEEIIPFVSNDINATTEFAESVKERFFNPFLNHQLLSISLNSISKWRARDLPSFKDYYEKFGKLPKHLATGFAYLMVLYKSITKEDGKFYANLPSKKVEFKDNIPYLEYFANGGSVIEFMKDEKVWGEDLTKYEGFASFVEKTVKALENGEKVL